MTPSPKVQITTAVVLKAAKALESQVFSSNHVATEVLRAASGNQPVLDDAGNIREDLIKEYITLKEGKTHPVQRFRTRVTHYLDQHSPGTGKYKRATRSPEVIFNKVGRGKYRFATADDTAYQSSTALGIFDHNGEYSPAQRRQMAILRVVRNPSLAEECKKRNSFSCQVCSTSLQLKDGKRYAECHHIQPLGSPHNGPDTPSNLLCVCPNCHVLLDHFSVDLDASCFHQHQREYIRYYNEYRVSDGD